VSLRPRRHDRTVKNGDPRTPADAAAIQHFDSRMAVPVVLSAVVPLFLLPNGSYPWLAAAVFIVSWVVFLVDLLFHVRHRVQQQRVNAKAVGRFRDSGHQRDDAGHRAAVRLLSARDRPLLLA